MEQLLLEGCSMAINSVRNGAQMTKPSLCCNRRLWALPKAPRRQQTWLITHTLQARQALCPLEYIFVMWQHFTQTAQSNKLTQVNYESSQGLSAVSSLSTFSAAPWSHLTFHLIILFYPGTTSITEDRAQERRRTLAGCIQVHRECWVQTQGALQHEGGELRMVHWEAWRGREPEDGVETKRKNALHILYLRQLPTVAVHQNYYHTLEKTQSNMHPNTWVCFSKWTVFFAHQLLCDSTVRTHTFRTASKGTDKWFAV